MNEPKEHFYILKENPIVFCLFVCFFKHIYGRGVEPWDAKNRERRRSGRWSRSVSVSLEVHGGKRKHLTKICKCLQIYKINIVYNRWFIFGARDAVRQLVDVTLTRRTPAVKKTAR